MKAKWRNVAAFSTSTRLLSEPASNCEKPFPLTNSHATC